MGCPNENSLVTTRPDGLLYKKERGMRQRANCHEHAIKARNQCHDGVVALGLHVVQRKDVAYLCICQLVI